MAEIINKLLKVFTALCLLLLSVLLLLWVFSLNMNYSFGHIVLILGVGFLTYLFISFSFTLFGQALKNKVKQTNPEILDEEEIKRHIKND